MSSEPADPPVDRPRDVFSTRFSLPLVLSGVVVVVAFVLRAASARFTMYDLDVYIAGAHAVWSGEDVYSVASHGLVFTYPTFAAVVFVPFAQFPSPAPWLITVASTTAYGAVCIVVARRLQMGVAVAALVAVGGIALEPLSRTVFLGQFNLVLMALVMVDVFPLPRRARGLLIGLATGIKLTPAVFVLYYVAKRDWASVQRAVAAVIATIVVGWVVAPGATSTYFGGRALSMEGFADYQVQSANQSLRGGLIRILGRPDVPLALWAACALLSMIAGGWLAWRSRAVGDDVGAVLALAIGGLLASPISWTHHWVWLIPCLMYAFWRGWRVGGWVLASLFFIGPMWFLPQGDGVELHYVWWQTIVSCAYVIAGLCYLTSLTRSRAPTGRGLGTPV